MNMIWENIPKVVFRFLNFRPDAKQLYVHIRKEQDVCKQHTREFIFTTFT
jgi:hypothetical protein